MADEPAPMPAMSKPSTRFKISTNAYSAESGRALGGTVNVSIKSGSNDVHGTVFHFLRNEKLDARNFFDPADKPPFKRNQFGFAVGGPIKKNSTFFFGDYEGTLIRESATFNETIPTQAQLGGEQLYLRGTRASAHPVGRSSCGA